jgi:hypothetical protein
MYSYDTVVEAVDGLRKRGFDVDFNLEADRIFSPGAGKGFKPADFEITEFYRFEGPSDPADEAVVYAISCRGGEKGLVVTGFGISAEGLGEAMVEKLSMRR